MGDVQKIPSPNGIYPQSLSSDDFHPEFGYLCPTPRTRLKLRMIAIWASIGMTIGAISVLAPVHSEGGESDRRELALSAAAAVPTADEAPAMLIFNSCGVGMGCKSLILQEARVGVAQQRLDVRR